MAPVASRTFWCNSPKVILAWPVRPHTTTLNFPKTIENPQEKTIIFQKVLSKQKTSTSCSLRASRKEAFGAPSSDLAAHAVEGSKSPPSPAPAGPRSPHYRRYHRCPAALRGWRPPKLTRSPRGEPPTIHLSWTWKFWWIWFRSKTCLFLLLFLVTCPDS